MHRYPRTCGLAVLAAVCLTRLAAAGVTLRDPPTGAASKGDAMEAPNVVDCPPDLRGQAPARTVVQIIGNTFHLWREFTLGTNFCIVLQQPESRSLSRQRALTLLAASSRWQDVPAAGAGREVLKATDARLRVTPMPLPVRPRGARGTPPRPSPGIACAVGEGMAQPRPAPIPPPAGRTVQGSDDRERVTNTGVFPYATMCYLDMEFPDGSYRGSGCVVTPYMVLTCGHNVFDKKAGVWASSVRIVPGQRQYSDGGDVEWPWGSTWAKWIATNTKYTEGGGYEYDYAAVHFNTPFWSQATYMPVEFGTTFAADDVINMSGYPGSAHGADTYSQWFAWGRVVSIEDGLIDHNMDSCGGSSGSAMYYYLPPAIRRIVGVHNYGAESCNGGAHMCEANAKLIVEWMQWTPDKQAPAARVVTRAGAAGAGREDAAPVVLAVPAGAGFTYTNAGSGRVELMVAPDADPAGADLRLLYAGAPGATPGAFSAWFEDHWFVIGPDGAAAKTFGDVFRLQSAQAGADGVVWTFEHSLPPGAERGLYEKQGDAWVRKARIRAPVQP